MLVEAGSNLADGSGHFDVTLQTAVLVSGFGAELLVDLPRYSMLGTSAQRRIGVGARIGVTW